MRKIPFLLFSLVFLIGILTYLTGDYLPNKDYIRIKFKENFKDKASKTISFFEKQENRKEYQLTYGWKDYKGNGYYISFAISKSQLKLAENEFGYYPKELKNYMEKISIAMIKNMMMDLKKFVEEKIKMSEYSKYIFIENVQGDSFKIKYSSPPELQKKVKKEYELILWDLKQRQEAYLKVITKELEKKRKKFLKERGIRVFDDKVEVDYEHCVKKNVNRLKNIFETIGNFNPNHNIYSFLNLILSFIQEIKYGEIPYSEDNKIILEFWVPQKVLVNNLGDCDSKAVVFASLWKNLKNYPIVLIKIPKHLFVGVAIPSPGRNYLTIRGLRFTLCEVSGPGKIPPGFITRYSEFYLKSGHFKYELIN